MDLKKVMQEVEQSHLNEAGLAEFTEAFTSSDVRLKAMSVAMKSVTEKMLAMAAVVTSEKELLEALRLPMFGKSPIALIYWGYQIGLQAAKEDAGVDALEKMFAGSFKESDAQGIN